MNDDYTPEQWAQIQANAKAALRRNPRDNEARSAFQAANAFLASQRQAVSAQEQAAPTGPTAVQALIRNAGQGITSGFADEYLGALEAARGPQKGMSAAPSFAGRQAEVTSQFRQDLANARGAQPAASLAGNIIGTVANPVNKLLGPLTAGLSPAATGLTYGATLGGLQGAGEGESGQRLTTGAAGAVLGGTVGLLLGYGGGKVSRPLGQMWRNLRGAFISTEKQVAKSLGPTAAPEAAQAAKEAAHRAYLAEQGYPPEVIDRLMATWSAKGKLPPNPPVVTAPGPEVPVRTRPGETLVQKGPREFEVTGTRATPTPPTTPTILEMQTGQKLYPVGPTARPADAAARNAYNYVQGLGAPDATATNAARGAAGMTANMENWDPRQALLLALLLGGGQRQ